MISFTDEKRWEILKLNVLQLFFRKHFGFFKSTHLNYLSDKSVSVKPSEETKKIHEYVQKNWFNSNIVCLGNSSIDDADVICFAERHGDYSFRTSVGKMINKHYRVGDVVLVEGLEAGKQVKPGEHQMVKTVDPHCHVQGWEPENFARENGSAFSESKLKYQQLMDSVSYFKELDNKDAFSGKNLETIKEKVKVFKNKVKELNKYYQSKSKWILNCDQILDHALDGINAGKYQDPLPVLVYMIHSIAGELEKEQEKALYSNMTPEKIAEIKKNVGPRNISLVNEIDKFSEQGKKVFVIAGASHLLQFPTPAYVDCDIVREALQKRKFAIITRKNELNHTVVKLNADLKKFPLKMD